MKTINAERLVERYLNILKRQNKDKTYKAYRKPLLDMLEYLRRDELDLNILEELDFTESILNFQDELAIKYTIASTYNLKINALRSFINYAFDRMLLSENFSKKLKYKKDTSKNSSTSKNVLSGEELVLLLDVLKNEINENSTPKVYYASIRNYILINLLFRLGLRREELSNIKWDDIDFKKKTIKIYGKGNKNRDIPLVDQLCKMLLDYYDRLEDLQDAGYSYLEPYLLTSSTKLRIKNQITENKKLAPHSINVILNQISKKLEFAYQEKTGLRLNKNIYPHLLRHTFASHAIESNVSPSTLQAIMGHSDVSITLKVYTHEINDKVRRSNMEKIDFGLDLNHKL